MEDGRDALVGIMDLDCFKGINDTYGHEFGDECLIEVAAALEEAFGKGCFRIGGDEFAVIHQRLDQEAVTLKYHSINDRLEKKFLGRNITTSAGYAFYQKGMDLTRTIKSADDALYSAKGGGRKRCCFAKDDPEKA